METFLFQLVAILIAILSVNWITRKLSRVLFDSHLKKINAYDNSISSEACLVYPCWVKVISFVPVLFLSVLIFNDLFFSETNKDTSFFVASFLLIAASIFPVLVSFGTRVVVDENEIVKSSWIGTKHSISWSDVSHISLNDNCVKLWNRKGCGDISVSLLFQNYFYFHKVLVKKVNIEKWSVEAKELMDVK